MTRRRALALIEVVFAIVILGLAVPALMIQISTGVKHQETAFIQQSLTQLAAERMNEIFADHANPTRGYVYIQGSAYPNEAAPRGLLGYGRQTEIREVSAVDYITPQSGTGLKRFRITVTGPRSQSLVVESFVGDTPGASP
jgi:type II secretory pathway pseudopilin PulG